MVGLIAHITGFVSNVAQVLTSQENTYWMTILDTHIGEGIQYNCYEEKDSDYQRGSLEKHIFLKNDNINISMKNRKTLSFPVNTLKTKNPKGKEDKENTTTTNL